DLFLIGPATELNGSSPNTFTGTTTANGGLLTLNKTPTGTAYAMSGPLVVGSGGSLATVRWSNDSQLNRSTASVMLYSNGLVHLNGHNDAIGSLTLAGGTVQNSGAATLSLFQNVTAKAASASASINGGRLALASGQPTFQIEASPVEPELAIGASIIGLGGMTKTGPGTLRLGGANSFAGPVNVNAGVLHIQTDPALGVPNAGTTIAGGATLRVGSVPGLDEPLTLGGTLELLPFAGVNSGIVLATNAFVRVNSSG